MTYIRKSTITTPDGRRWFEYAPLTRVIVDMAQFAQFVRVPVSTVDTTLPVKWDVVTTVGYPENAMVVTVEELTA